MFRKTDSRVVFSAKSVNLKLKFKAKTILDIISGRTGGEKIKSNLFQRNLTQSVRLFYPFTHLSVEVVRQLPLYTHAALLL